MKTKKPAAPANIKGFTGLEDVEHLGALTFHVESRTRGLKHQVDLAANNGVGLCGCEDFTYNLGPALKLGATPGTAFQCYHIARALRWMGQKLALMTVEESKKSNADRNPR